MNIKQCRINAGVDRTKLADLLNIDVSTIAKWETGSAFPRASLLPQIADILNCSIDALFGRDWKGGEG